MSTPATPGHTVTGDYQPSPMQFVADHVAAIEEQGSTDAAPHPSGLQVVLLRTLGAKTGKVRKFPLMRVEHDGNYLAVASKAGAPEHPQWYHNLRAHPTLDLLDGQTWRTLVARELPESGAERERWWKRAVDAFPTYADYQEKAGGRIIPLFVLEPVSTGT